MEIAVYFNYKDREYEGKRGVSL